MGKLSEQQIKSLGHLPSTAKNLYWYLVNLSKKLGKQSIVYAKAYFVKAMAKSKPTIYQAFKILEGLGLIQTDGASVWDNERMCWQKSTEITLLFQRTDKTKVKKFDPYKESNKSSKKEEIEKEEKAFELKDTVKKTCPTPQSLKKALGIGPRKTERLTARVKDEVRKKSNYKLIEMGKKYGFDLMSKVSTFLERFGDCKNRYINFKGLYLSTPNALMVTLKRMDLCEFDFNF